MHDLVAPIHPPGSQGNKYILDLTVIDMLTGFTMAVPIPNKIANTIWDAYRDHIYCMFGGSSRIPTDDGSEFKSKKKMQVCQKLGVKHIFSPVYTSEVEWTSQRLAQILHSLYSETHLRRWCRMG